MLIRVVVEVSLRANAVVLIGAGHWLHVPVGKLHDDRYLPLHPHLVTLIADYRATHVPAEHPLLLPRENGRPLDRHTVTRLINKACARPACPHPSTPLPARPVGIAGHLHQGGWDRLNSRVAPTRRNAVQRLRPKQATRAYTNIQLKTWRALPGWDRPDRLTPGRIQRGFRRIRVPPSGRRTETHHTRPRPPERLPQLPPSPLLQHRQTHQSRHLKAEEKEQKP
jgi:hypothetical protein